MTSLRKIPICTDHRPGPHACRARGVYKILRAAGYDAQPREDAVLTSAPQEVVDAAIERAASARRGVLPTREILQVIRYQVILYRDPSTGIAWVQSFIPGHQAIYTAHPRVSSAAAAERMIKLGRWKREHRLVTSRGMIFDVDILDARDEWSEAARRECRCGGKH